MLDIYTKPECGQVDGQDFFAAPTQRKPVKRTSEQYTERRIAAVGALRPGSEKVEMVADASLNNGVVGVVCGEAFNAVYVSEEDLMNAALDAVRSGVTTPIIRLTPEQLDELERERPGEDYCTRPYLY